MKILFIISNGLSGGGAERVATMLCSKWVEEHDVFIYSTCSITNDAHFDISDKIRLSGFNNNKHRGAYTKIKEIRNIIKKNKIDICLGFTINSDMLICAASIGLRVKKIFGERNSPADYPKDKKLRLFRNFVFKSADGVVVQTEDIKNWFIKKIQKKMVVIPNPCVESNFVTRKRNDDIFRIISIGRLDEQKNYQTALLIFKKFNELYPNSKYDIYGKGALESSLKEFINDHDINNVYIHTFNHNAKDELCASDVLLFTSLYEGMPNVLIEAIMSELPIVTSNFNGGAASYLVNNDYNGIVYGKPNDINSGLIALKKVYNNLKIYKDNCVIFKKDFYKDNNLDDIANKWILLFDNLLIK